MAKRKNIVFILTDDQGLWSLGCYGNREVISPNIDALAQRGALFENFFCTSPVCSPARASIMTGLLPSQHGVVDWLAGGSVRRSDYDNVMVDLRKSASNLAHPVENIDQYPEGTKVSFKETISYQKYMGHETEPIEYLKNYVGYTDLLVKNGYTCGLSGKWHLGDSMHPQKGFSFWRVIARGGTQYSQAEYIRDGKVEIYDRYITDVITDDALEFIEQQAGQENPFYASIHYTAPHDPWEKDDQPEEIWNLYEDCPFASTPKESLHPEQAPGNRYAKSEEDRKDIVRGYYTTITALDQNVGRIVKKLEELGILEDTILFFTSDNGYNLGHHGIWGKGNGTIPFNMYDTSVKVPMIICAPGCKPGVVKEMASQYDLFPTILELAGIPFEDPNGIYPGKSFKGLLDGSTEHFRDEVVVYDEYGPVRMIRTREFKYVCRIPGGPNELYYLVDDPEEQFNLISDSSYRAVRNRMHKQLMDWFDKYVDPKHDASKMPMIVWGETRNNRYAKLSTGQCNLLEEIGSDKVVFPSF